MKRIVTLVLIFSLFLPSVISLFKPYVSGTADGLGHRFRLVSFKKSLDEGIWRPRWTSEVALGYGAPIFLFNYPLPYYVASFFLSLGFDVDTSGKLLSATSLVLSFIFMYLLAKKLSKNQLAGLVGALVYTYAPYHLQMTYLYDSWGEQLAFVFPPLILYLILRLKDCYKRNLILTLSWFLFILSHNVSALMFSPILLFLGFLLIRKKKTSLRDVFVIVNPFILAVLISSFFWLPAWALKDNMKYTDFIAGESAMRGSFFKSLSFQLATAWQVIRVGVAHYLDFTIGLPILLVVLSSIITPPMWNRYDTSGAIVYLLLIFVVSIYLANHASNWLWQLPLISYPLSFILYPFRFLFVAAFAGSLLAALVSRKHWLIGGGLIFLTLVQGRPYLNSYTDIFPFKDSYFYQGQAVSSAPQTRKNMLIKEFLPKWASLEFLKKQEETYYKTGKLPEKLILDKEAGKIITSKVGGEKIETEIEMSRPSSLTVNTFFFPNWQGFLDGRKVPLAKDKDGAVVVNIPQGRHKLNIVFGKSKVEKIADIITILGIGLFLTQILVLWKISKTQYTKS